MNKFRVFLLRLRKKIWHKKKDPPPRKVLSFEFSITNTYDLSVIPKHTGRMSTYFVVHQVRIIKVYTEGKLILLWSIVLDPRDNTTAHSLCTARCVYANLLLLIFQSWLQSITSIVLSVPQNYLYLCPLPLHSFKAWHTHMIKHSMQLRTVHIVFLCDQ